MVDNRHGELSLLRDEHHHREHHPTDLSLHGYITRYPENHRKIEYPTRSTRKLLLPQDAETHGGTLRHSMLQRRHAG